MDFYICIGSLILTILLGLSLARYNLRDDEARELRLKMRREQRKKRRAPWRWPT